MKIHVWMVATEKQLHKVKTMAENGDAEAQLFLAELYFKGNSFLNIEEDIAAGTEWLIKAVEQKYAPAMLFYGEMLYEGDKMEKNIIRALAYVDAAANQGLPEAQLKMSSLLFDIKNPYYDEETAVMWEKKAEEEFWPNGKPKHVDIVIDYDWLDID